jgi:hypothetical protein
VTVDWDNHVLAGNPSLFVQVDDGGFHDPPHEHGGSCYSHEQAAYPTGDVPGTGGYREKGLDRRKKKGES